MIKEDLFRKIFRVSSQKFYYYILSQYLSLVNRQQFDDIHTYCMFIGYPRSGHSLIGAILDAHPNIVLAHELDVLPLVRKNATREHIFGKILAQSKWFIANGAIWTGYSYKVPNQWQGTFNKLMIIGDKKGGASSKVLSKEPHLIDRLQQICNINIKLIHVIRNPFDNIATRAIKGTYKERPVDEKIIDAVIEAYFRDVQTVQNLKENTNYEILDVKSENFVISPKERLIKLCHFLDITYTEEYLEDCSSIVYKAPHRSRHKISWNKKQIEMITTRMQQYSFLRDYSYDH